MDQAPDEMGKQAARILIENMSGGWKEKKAKEVRIPVKLIIRASCGINCIKMK